MAEAIQRRFDDLDFVYNIGELDLNISGCMNSCGHHHIGHIGILGVDKQGAEFYQISIGGAQGNEASLGKVLGPFVSQDEVPDVVEKLIEIYLERRDGEAERFIDVVRRIGIEPSRNTCMALIKDRKRVTDNWQLLDALTVGEDGSLPPLPAGDVIVPAAGWTRARAQFIGRTVASGSGCPARTTRAISRVTSSTSGSSP